MFCEQKMTDSYSMKPLSLFWWCVNVNAACVLFWTRLSKGGLLLPLDTYKVKIAEEWAARESNWSVNCTGSTCLCMCVYLCTYVRDCVGGVKVTLNWGVCFLCVSVRIPLERVRWRLSSASTSICRKGTNKLFNTIDSPGKLSLIWIHVLSGSECYFHPVRHFSLHLMCQKVSCRWLMGCISVND